MILAINASRARSGGARAHLIGIISELRPELFGFSKVHVWSYQMLLDELPDKPWLIKHTHHFLEKSLIFQIYWEIFHLKHELTRVNFDIILNVDGGSFARVAPSVSMSRDMLSYEEGEIDRYPLFSLQRLRLITLKYVQNSTFKKSDGVIFLTKHAAKEIQKSCGPLKHIAHISHGVSKNFFPTRRETSTSISKNVITKCIYVSPIWPFKHQWNVVEALHSLRRKGFAVELLLVGAGDARGFKKFNDAISKFDPDGEFVTYQPAVSHEQLPALIQKSDLFVFASSCENMPNTVLEGMASGLPIACSNRGPMKEVLGDGGVYFDPEDVANIADTLEQLIVDKQLQLQCVAQSSKLIKKYSWSRCADETLSFLSETYDRYIQGN